ncbi:MAG: hypothetical protein ACPGTP_02085 [Bacteroidia bacterium]
MNSVGLEKIKPFTLNSLANFSSILQPIRGFEINPYKKNLNTLLAFYNVNKPTNQFELISSSVLVTTLNVDGQINLNLIPMDKLQREAAMNLKLDEDRHQTELYRAGRDLNVRTFELYNSRNRKK